MDEVEISATQEPVLFRVIEIGSILYELPSPSPLVTLVEAESPYRSFSLAIALPEAQAMALAQEKTPGARPATHELFTSFIQAIQADVIAVRIIRHENGVFCAEIDLMTPTGHVVLDCRPSDGIIMALRQPVTAPILCAEEILAELH